MKGPGAPRSKGGCLSTLLAEELPSGWRVPGWAGNSGCAAREVPRGAFLPAPWVTRSAVGPPMAPQGQRQPQAGRRHCLGPPLVFSLAPGFWGAVCQGAAGPGRVLGLPKQRQGQLCRVGRLHAQPCPLPAQPCQGDPGSRIHCGQGPGGGWWDPPWGKGTPSAGSRTGGPRFALTGGKRGPEPEQCTARSPATRARMLWSMCQGSQVKDPQCSRAGGLQQHGAGRHYRH